MLSEEAFKTTTKSNFSNMRLIEQVTLPLKAIPFDEQNVAMNYELRMSLPTSEVVTLTFNFRYECQVPRKLIGQPPKDKQGQLLFFKMI